MYMYMYCLYDWKGRNKKVIDCRRNLENVCTCMYQYINIHCFLCRDGCVKCSHVDLGNCSPYFVSYYLYLALPTFSRVFRKKSPPFITFDWYHYYTCYPATCTYFSLYRSYKWRRKYDTNNSFCSCCCHHRYCGIAHNHCSRCVVSIL